MLYCVRSLIVFVSKMTAVSSSISGSLNPIYVLLECDPDSTKWVKGTAAKAAGFAKGSHRGFAVHKNNTQICVAVIKPKTLMFECTVSRELSRELGSTARKISHLSQRLIVAKQDVQPDSTKLDLRCEVDSPELREIRGRVEALVGRLGGVFAPEDGGHCHLPFGAMMIQTGADLRPAIDAAQAVLNRETTDVLCTPRIDSGSMNVFPRSQQEFVMNLRRFFDGARISTTKQNKHIPGTLEYSTCTESKSIFVSGMDPTRLLMQARERGFANPTKGAIIPWLHGYKEDFDFGFEIGSTEGTPTTWGRIHYDKGGEAHIVPIRPPAPGLPTLQHFEKIRVSLPV